MAQKMLGTNLSKITTFLALEEFVPYEHRDINKCLEMYDAHTKKAYEINDHSIFMMNAFVAYACGREFVYNKAQEDFKDKYDWMYNFLVAASKEAYEAESHDSAYAWWKPGKRDLPALKMEIVDIFHFIMDAYIAFNHDMVSTYVSRVFDASNFEEERALETEPEDELCPFDELIAELSQLRTFLRLTDFNATLTKQDHEKQDELLESMLLSMMLTFLKTAAKFFDTKEEFLDMFIKKARRNIERQIEGYHDDLSKKYIGNIEDNDVILEKIKKD